MKFFKDNTPAYFEILYLFFYCDMIISKRWVTKVFYGLASNTVFINEKIPQTWTNNGKRCNSMDDLLLKRFYVQDVDEIMIHGIWDCKLVCKSDS